MSSTKRPSSADEEDGIANKKAKCAESELMVAGYIEKVYVKNFMCHSALEVTLNKRINFIVGRNGSGKSAILAAVVIAFGCKAACTNRASSLKEFIKSGANSATVQVTLCNEGLYAYKPEIYGPKIIVIRNIYSGSTPCSYKFKSAKGEIISTKREELQKIVTAFNIQVDNPVCVLNQDTARTFLATSDTKSKYSIFMKATRLEDVDNLHAKTLNTEAAAKDRLKLRQESMLHQENEIDELQKKANALNKLKEMKKRASDLENELVWAEARDEENKLTDLQFKIDKKKDNSQPLQNLLEQSKKKLERKLNELRETGSVLEEKNKNVKDAMEKLSKANKESKEVEAAYSASLSKYKQLQKQERQTNLDIRTIKEEIAKYKGRHESTQKREELNEAIDMCKLEQNKILAIQQTTEMEYQNLRGEFEYYREQEMSIKSDKRTAEQAMSSKKYQLEKLKVQSDNLTMYGDWMPRLLQHIEECHKQRKFVRKPLGPLGALLKVQDAKWARAIELEIGSVLRSFACHCGQDAHVLRNLFREVGTGSRYPGILVSKFTDKVHNIRDSCVKSSGYQNIFDTLHFSDSNVANCLVDNCSIEGILLIPTGKEAAKMMSQNVPKNCKKSITLTADQYFPYPDYRMYAGNQRARVSLLQVSKQDIIRQLQGELEAEQQNLVQIDGKLQDFSEKMRKNRDRQKDIEKRIMDLRTSKSRLNAQLNELESAFDLLPDPQHWLVLESELKELSKKVEDLQQQLTEADKESDELKVKVKCSQEKFKVIRSEVQELEETRQKIQIQMGNFKDAVKREEVKTKDLEAAYAAHCSDLEKLLLSLKQQQDSTQKSVAYACSICSQGISSKRRVAVINNELTDCKSYQNTVEVENGKTSKVLDILQNKKKKFDDNMQVMKDLEDGLQTLAQSLMERERLYKSIRRIMAMRVLFMFQPLLTTRSYKGDMTFNHEARTLDVDISPVEETGKRDTKSLSGGERSYSTVTFILSLWECVEPPFYFMDEFDVFMDKVNRRVVIELLQSHAEAHKKHQYVFLTPQDTSTVTPSDTVTIHRLDDPERMTVD